MEDDVQDESSTTSAADTAVALWDRTRPKGAARPTAAETGALPAPPALLALGAGDDTEIETETVVYTVTMVDTVVMVDPAAAAVVDEAESDDEIEVAEILYTVEMIAAEGVDEGTDFADFMESVVVIDDDAHAVEVEPQWDPEIPLFVQVPSDAPAATPNGGGIRSGVVVALIALAVVVGALGGAAGAWFNASRTADSERTEITRAHADELAAAAAEAQAVRTDAAAAAADATAKIAALEGQVAALTSSSQAASASAAQTGTELAAAKAQLVELEKQRVFFEALAKNYEEKLKAAAPSPTPAP